VDQLASKLASEVDSSTVGQTQVDLQVRIKVHKSTGDEKTNKTTLCFIFLWKIIGLGTMFHSPGGSIYDFAFTLGWNCIKAFALQLY